jgi:hypothetical protein
MVSIKVRRGPIALVVALLCTHVGCAVAPESSGNDKAPQSQSALPHHIVYLIDRSGSMFDFLDEIKSNVMNSVKGLQPDQDFHVIMFADGQPYEKNPMTLTPPTEENFRSLAKFFSRMQARRTVNPIKGIIRAFDVLDKANNRPGKVIHLLTDGSFPDNEAIIAAIRAKNAGKDVIIYTYLYGARKSPIAEKVMKLIAAENGGLYRYVDPDE